VPAKGLVVALEHLFLVGHLPGGLQLLEQVANVPELDCAGYIHAHRVEN